MMAPIFVVLASLGILGLVVVQARMAVATRDAAPYAKSSRAIAVELLATDDSDVGLRCTVLDYRWRPRKPNDQMDWLGQVDITRSALYLRPRYTYAVLLGIPLFLPSYRLPLGSIMEVRAVQEPAPPRVFRLLRKRTSEALEITMENEAKCLLAFRSVADAQAAREALSRR